ncbi:MAG: hypothetical protein AABZ65_07470, partial [Candidatus Omnitrophota bacterium]
QDMLVKKYQAEIKVNKDKAEVKVEDRIIMISEAEKELLKSLFIKYLPKDKLETESKLDKVMAGLEGEEKALAQTEIKIKKDVLMGLVKDMDKVKLEELIEIREIIRALGYGMAIINAKNEGLKDKVRALELAQIYQIARLYGKEEDAIKKAMILGEIRNSLLKYQLENNHLLEFSLAGPGGFTDTYNADGVLEKRVYNSEYKEVLIENYEAVDFILGQLLEYAQIKFDDKVKIYERVLKDGTISGYRIETENKQVEVITFNTKAGLVEIHKDKKILDRIYFEQQYFSPHLTSPTRGEVIGSVYQRTLDGGSFAGYSVFAINGEYLPETGTFLSKEYEEIHRAIAAGIVFFLEGIWQAELKAGQYEKDSQDAKLKEEIRNINSELSKANQELIAVKRAMLDFIRSSGFINETCETRRLAQEEMRLNREIAYLEEKSSRLSAIKRLEEEIEGLDVRKSVYGRLAFAPDTGLARYLRELNDLKIKVENKELERLELEKEPFSNPKIQDILKALANKEITAKGIDEELNKLKEIDEDYRKRFADLFNLYRELKELREGLERYDSRKKLENTDQNKPQEESAGDPLEYAQAAKEQQEDAQKMVKAFLTKLELNIEIPQDVYANFPVLSQWLEKHIFIGLLAQADIYLLLKERLTIGYGLKLGALGLDEKAEYGRIEKIKDISQIKMSIPNPAALGIDQSLSILSIYSGLQNDNLTAGLSVGGVIDQFWSDVYNLFTQATDINKDELVNIAARLDRAMVGALDRYEAIRFTLLAAIENFQESQKAKEIYPLVYLEALNQFQVVQKAYHKLYGAWIDERTDIETLKSDTLKAVSEDFAAMREMIEQRLKLMDGEFKLKAKEHLGLFSNIFVNLGFNYGGGSLNFTSVLGVTLFDGSKGLKNGLSDFKEKALALYIIENKNNLEALISGFDHKISGQADFGQKYFALYQKAVTQERLETIDCFEPLKLLELLNDPDRISEEQKQKERSGQNSSQEFSAKSKEEAKEMLENFEKNEDSDNRAGYEPVKKDMLISEIIRISLKNKDRLTYKEISVEEFGRFINNNLRVVVVFEGLSLEKISWKEVQALARIMAEQADIKFSEIKLWLDKTVKDQATHTDWGELKSKWAGLNKKELSQDELIDFLKRLDGWISKDFIPAMDKRLEMEKFQEGLLYERLRNLGSAQNELVAENIRLIEHKVRLQNARDTYEQVMPKLLGQDELGKKFSPTLVNTNAEIIKETEEKLTQLGRPQAELDQELAWAKNELIRINNNRLEDLRAAITKATDTKEKEQLLRQKEAIETQIVELNKIVSCDEKLEQARERKLELTRKIIEGGLSELAKFEQIIKDPAVSTLERNHYLMLLQGFLMELEVHSLILDKTWNEKGELVSKDWIQNKLSEIIKASHEAQKIRQDKKNEYRSQADEMIKALLMNEEYPLSKKEAKAKNIPRHKITMQDDLSGLLSKYEAYLEKDELIREKAAIAKLENMLTHKQDNNEWSELSGKSPPDVLAYLSDYPSKAKQLEVLMSFLEACQPAYETSFKASLIGILFGMFSFSQSPQSRGKYKEPYQEFLRSYIEALYIYAGDILTLLDDPYIKEGLGTDTLKTIAKIQKEYSAPFRLDTNIIQIEAAIEKAGYENNQEMLIKLKALKAEYIKAFNESFLEAKYTYLTYLDTNPKPFNMGATTNPIMTGIMFLTNSISNFLSGRENKERERVIASEILSGLEGLAGYENNSGLKADKSPKEEIYLSDKGEVFIRTIVTKNGVSRYGYLNPAQYYEAMRQNVIYQDNNFTLSTVPPGVNLLSNEPQDELFQKNALYSGRHLYRVPLDEDMNFDLAYDWFMDQKAFNNSFDEPREQRISFRLGRQSEFGQDVQVTYIRSVDGEDRVLLALSGTKGGLTVSPLVELNSKGEVTTVGLGVRKTYKIGEDTGSIGMFATNKAFTFFFNQRLKQWEVRMRQDYDYNEKTMRFNFESLRWSSIGQTAAGLGLTYSDESLIPYFILETGNLLGNKNIQVRVGWDMNRNEMAYQIGLQSTVGRINPYVNFANTDLSSGFGSSEPQSGAGVRFNEANNKYVDLGMLADTSTQQASIGGGYGPANMAIYAPLNSGSSLGGIIGFNVFNWFGRNRWSNPLGVDMEFIPQGNIRYAQGQTAMLRDIIRNMYEGSYREKPSFRQSLAGIFGDGMDDDVRENLTALGADNLDLKKNREQEVVKEGLFNKYAKKKGLNLFQDYYEEFTGYMLKAKNLETAKEGYGLQYYLYQDNYRALDIDNPLDFWEMVYFAGMIKESGLEKAADALNRMIKARSEVEDILGRGFNPADEEDVRFLRLFADMPGDISGIEKALSKIDTKYLAVIVRLVKQAESREEFDPTSENDLAQAIFWLRAIENNGYGMDEDIQILRNTLVVLERGESDKNKALTRAVELHKLIMEKEGLRSYSAIKAYNLLEFRAMAIGDELAVKLSSLIKGRVIKETLSQALEEVKDFEDKGYYHYLVYYQYAALTSADSLKGLLSYIQTVEEITGKVKIEFDFKSEKHFENLVYWARVLDNGEGISGLKEKLEEMFNLDRSSFDSRLKGNQRWLSFLLGQEKLSEVNGKPAEVLRQSLKEVEGFYGDALTQSGIKDVQGRLKQIYSYEILTSALVKEPANNGKDTIYMPLGYFSVKNIDKLTQALAHEIGALYGLEHNINEDMEDLFSAWKPDKAVVITESMKGLILSQVLAAKVSDRHQSGAYAAESDVNGEITELSNALNSASIEAQTVFEEAYDTQVQPLTWDQNDEEYRETLGGIVGGPEYQSAALFVETLDAVYEIKYNFSQNAKDIIKEAYSIDLSLELTPEIIESISDNLLFQKDKNDIDTTRDYWYFN